jgi:hypothetical protein
MNVCNRVLAKRFADRLKSAGRPALDERQAVPLHNSAPRTPHWRVRIHVFTHHDRHQRP